MYLEDNVIKRYSAMIDKRREIMFAMIVGLINGLKINMLSAVKISVELGINSTLMVHVRHVPLS